jgi:hypothetical protein
MTRRDPPLGHDGGVGFLGRALLVVTAGGAAAVLAACGASGTGGGGSSGPPSPPATSGSASASPSVPATRTPSTTTPVAGDAATLTVDYVGGLAPTPMNESVPWVSLWSDGLAEQRGAAVTVYPPPALPSVMVSHVDPAAMPRVLETIADGLTGLPEDFGYPPTADVPSTVVTWRGAGEEHTWTVLSLGVGDDQASDGVTPEQVQARQQVTRVVDYATAVASGDVEGVPVSAQEPYEVPAWYVWSVPMESTDSSVLPRDWPLSPLPVADGWSCQVVEGADADEVTAVMTGAYTTTPWISRKRPFSIRLRPLLPGDPDTCP